MRKVWDCECNDLLNEKTIDYTASPYKPTEDFKIWCLVQRDIDNPEDVQKWVGLEKIKAGIEQSVPFLTTLVAHNGIDYDFLVLKLLGIISYEIDEFDSHNCSVTLLSTGQTYKVRIVDTLVLSKTLNPDRFGGHSLEEWGVRTGHSKTDWRQEAIDLGLIQHNAPKGAEFKQYHPRMLEYCAQDTLVNVHTFHKLVGEWGDWSWEGPFSLEQRVRDIITRQSHRGFWFNSEKATENVHDLDTKMEEIRQIVEPLIPPKPMGVTKLKEYQPPKIQFKKNGEVSGVLQKWVDKHGGEIRTKEDGQRVAYLYGREWVLPMKTEEPILTHEPASVRDTTHIKGWLVGLGWCPTAYKERDLTVDTKKVKLSKEKYLQAAERYIEQTLSSPFCKDRCDELGVTRGTLASKLRNWDHVKRPLKVYTNPTFTVGMEKEIDPALLELADKFPHAKLVSEYLTFSHRRNSILGGGVDPDELDDEDDEWVGKGFLASERISIDRRIPTPADTCGASTSRFKHRLVANIPRVTSLYGKEMRGLFGADADQGFYQMGYDFDSLEANIEAHYVYKYPGGPEYGVSLTAVKPYDCHTVLAKKISALLGRVFPRNPAKNVKYGCSYNAQPARIAKTVGCSQEDGKIIFDAFWEQAAPLKQLKEKMQAYWETTGQKKFLVGLDGRKLPVRSKGNVINTAFQSAGVICAKRAMVLHDRMLKAEGLAVDFWRDDWKSMDFCQQLIAYHK
jgi:hypothetical protein